MKTEQDFENVEDNIEKDLRFSITLTKSKY